MQVKNYLLQGGEVKAITEQSFPNGILRDSDDVTKADVYRLYGEVAWFRRAVDVISQAVSSLPRALHSWDGGAGEEISEDHAGITLKLSARLDEMVGDLLLSGAAYAHITRNDYGQGGFLQRFHPSTIKPVWSSQDGLAQFERRIESTTTTYEADALAYCWSSNRRAETGNDQGVASAGARAARVLLNTGKYYETYFASGAINPTLISVGASTKTDMDRLRTWWQRTISGVKKAFAVEVVEGEVKATSIGSNPRDLAARELTDLQREEIATAFGVPQSILASNAANFATAGNDSLMLYELTVVPIAERLFEALNEQLHKIGLHLIPHPERLEVYQRREIEKANAGIALLQAGVMTADELRQYIGLQTAEETTIEAPHLPDSPPHPENVSQDDPMLTEQDAIRADVRKLWTVARKRLGEGKIGKVEQFTSDAIPAGRLAGLKARLIECADVEAIDRVIGQALLDEPEWACYG